MTKRKMHQNSLANLDPANLEDPAIAAIKHGARMADGALMRCEKCCLREQCPEACEGECPAEVRYVEERREAIQQQPHIDLSIDGPSVSVLIWLELRLVRWSRYLTACGETLPGAPDFLGVHPGDKHVTTLLNTWSRLIEKLGLTPPARAQLHAGPMRGRVLVIEDDD